MEKQIIYQGPGFLTLLTLTFIILKLCNVIDWSWFWVLSPIVIPAIIGIVVIVILSIITVWHYSK